MLTVALIKVCNALDAIIPLVVMSGPQDTEELRVKFTHEELFQFYSQVKTNENRLVFMCARACVRATYMVLVKGTTVQVGAVWRCAEWKCGEVEIVTCGHL